MCVRVPTGLWHSTIPKSWRSPLWRAQQRSGEGWGGERARRSVGNLRLSSFPRAIFESRALRPHAFPARALSRLGKARLERFLKDSRVGDTRHTCSLSLSVRFFPSPPPCRSVARCRMGTSPPGAPQWTSRPPRSAR